MKFLEHNNNSGGGVNSKNEPDINIDKMYAQEYFVYEYFRN